MLNSYKKQHNSIAPFILSCYKGVKFLRFIPRFHWQNVR